MAGAMRKMGVYLGLVEEDPEHLEEYDEYEEYESAPAPRRDAPAERADHTRALHPVRDDRPLPPAAAARPAARHEAVDSYKITTLHPRNYNDARTVGEYFRDGTPVIMNLTDMEDADAKRLVDFAAGLVFGLHGSIERVTSKVFLLSPADVEVATAERVRVPERGFFNQS